MTQQARQRFTILKKSFRLIGNSNPLLLSAATAFFTTFALAPILINLSHLLNIFFNEDIILPKLFAKLTTAFGKRATHSIERIVENFLSLETSTWVTVALAVFFYFVATTWLSAIRQSIHQLWNIREKPHQKLRYHIKERLIEIGLILLIGALFLITVGIDYGLVAIREAFTGGVLRVLFSIINILLSVLIISTWLACVYRFMPEAHVGWRVALAGGLCTGVLFVLGRYGITKILVEGKLGELFGPSSSIATILLFIFYCSFILYFGASFTYEYGNATGHPIRPAKLGEKYKEEVVETGTKKAPVH
ncbi:membrane protein [Chryseolinea serpens]|uniref:Membrane protein n=1 Tax=Chryseolinea serpens TaxID=947013 RepID=A0A1M5XCF9_9BACT|nr:YhjD/YihY/BrkB family envelope integrity protein [Chryseolinea serpens]SHH97214.1 membrane protein [Chryseolinea serpens]